jgi:hypothetical protein
VEDKRSVSNSIIVTVLPAVIAEREERPRHRERPSERRTAKPHAQRVWQRDDRGGRDDSRQSSPGKRSMTEEPGEPGSWPKAHHRAFPAEVAALRPRIEATYGHRPRCSGTGADR